MNARSLKQFIGLMTIATLAWSCNTASIEGSGLNSVECSGGQPALLYSFNFGDNGLYLTEARTSTRDIEIDVSLSEPLPEVMIRRTVTRSTHISPIEPMSFRRHGEWVPARSRTPTTSVDINLGSRLHYTLGWDSKEVEDSELCIDGNGDIFFRSKEK